MELRKIHHCNFLDNNLPDKCAKLLIFDPPYFEVKGDFDFIWPTFQDYLKDVRKWVIEAVRIMADDGTLVWWGHAKKIAYTQVIIDEYLELINHVVWHKTDCQTRKGIDNYNIFPPTKEHLLIYSAGAASKVKSITEVRDYIRGEIEKKHGKVILNNINLAIGAANNGGGGSLCMFKFE